MTGTNPTLDALRDLLQAKNGEATFTFGPFEDQDATAPVIHGRLLAVADPSGTVWAGMAADGARLWFELDHSSGQIELELTLADGTSRSVRSVLELAEIVESPAAGWLFYLLHSQDGQRLYELSLNRAPAPAREANAPSGRGLVPAWVSDVESRADSLEGELLRVSRRSPSMRYDSGYLTAEKSIDKARLFAKRTTLGGTDPATRRWYRPWRRFTDWWTGYCVDMAWDELHIASQALLAIEDEAVVKAQLADLAAAVVTELTPGDLRINGYLQTLGVLAKPDRSLTPADRAQLRTIRAVCDTSSDGGHSDARSFRNTLILIGSFLTVVLAAVAVIGAADTGFAALFSAVPKTYPGAWFVLELELIASLAGLTSAVLSLHNYTGFRWSYGLPFVQGLVKGATGAATGLFGVLLVRSGLVTSLKIHGNVEVFATAIIFGYAQYLFTRLIDQKAKDVLKSASSRDDPDVAPQAPAGATLPSLVTTRQ